MKLRLAVAALVIGCSGNSPTEPNGTAHVVTKYGTISVWSDGSSYNQAAIVRSLEAGYERAVAQVGRLPTLDGIMVAVYKRQVWTGVPSVGAYSSDTSTIFVLAGVEEVCDHEVQHWAAWKLGLRGDCYWLQDHRPGYDLNCHYHS